MKKIIIVLPLLLSCQASYGKGFFSKLANAFAGAVAQSSYSSEQARVNADAWLNGGSGGRVLAATNIALAIVDEHTEQDISDVRKHMSDATQEFVHEENYHTGSVENLVGTYDAYVKVLARKYDDQKRAEKEEREKQEREVEKEREAEMMRRARQKQTIVFANPVLPDNSSDEGLRIEYVDYATGEIKYKEPSKYMNDLAARREREHLRSISETVEPACGISLTEYNSLTGEARVEADRRILEYVSKPVAEEAPAVVEEAPVEPVTPEYYDVINSLVIGDFAFDATTLTAAQQEELNQVANYMLENADFCITIVGHTCSIGKESVNMRVGQRRAEEARNYLMARGVEACRVNVETHGYSEPIASNDTPDGRKTNRRITFIISE